ncbi:DUF4912 domain-containing protein [bacterium]|nr:DUF4912 domain-containing protein [bacterium]
MAGRLSDRYSLTTLAVLRVADLRALAREHQLIGASALRKAELITALHRHLVHLDAAAAERGRERAERLPVQAPPPAVAAVPASETTPAAAPPADDPGAMRDPSWYAPPLAERYGIDRLTLMVRDPHWLFCYWELRPELLAAVRAEFPGPSWTVLRILHLDEAEAVYDTWTIDIGGDAVSWYVNTGRPGARFRAELGLTDADGRYRLLVASNTVTAPMDAPSARWDEEWVGVSREVWEQIERMPRPFPGSVAGWDQFRRDLARLGAERVGASERLSAAAPGSAAGKRS